MKVYVGLYSHLAAQIRRLHLQVFSVVGELYFLVTTELMTPSPSKPVRKGESAAALNL